MAQRGGFRRWTWLRRSSAGVFLVLLLLGCFHWFPWFKGSTTATLALDLMPLADPLAAVEVMLASRGWHVRLLIGAGLLLAFCVVMGPVFCGWVCPLGLVLDLNHGLRERIRRLSGKRRRPTVSRRIPSQIKYGVLGLVLGFSLTGHVPAFQTVSPINIVAWSAQSAIAAGRLAQAESVSGDWWEYLMPLGPALLLVFGIVAVEYFSPRLWCRCLCPLGAFYALFGRFAWLRVRIDTAEAGKMPCEQCTRHCPMGIRVMEDYFYAGAASLDHPDCTRCGACVDACPRGILKLGFRASPPTADHSGP